MLYKIINTYADESDFILNLIDDHPYIGWYMLLRLGESDTTKATLTRRECIEIIRKDGSYARNIFSYVYKAVDITVGNIHIFKYIRKYFSCITSIFSNNFYTFSPR